MPEITNFESFHSFLFDRPFIIALCFSFSVAFVVIFPISICFQAVALWWKCHHLSSGTIPRNKNRVRSNNSPSCKFKCRIPLKSIDKLELRHGQPSRPFLPLRYLCTRPALRLSFLLRQRMKSFRIGFLLEDFPLQWVGWNAWFDIIFMFQTTETDLREHFEKFYAVKDVKMVKSLDGTSKGYGFITFDTEDQAEAIRQLSPKQLEFRNRKLNLGPAIRKINASAFPPGKFSIQCSKNCWVSRLRHSRFQFVSCRIAIAV